MRLIRLSGAQTFNTLIASAGKAPTPPHTLIARTPRGGAAAIKKPAYAGFTFQTLKRLNTQARTSGCFFAIATFSILPGVTIMPVTLSCVLKVQLQLMFWHWL